MISNLWDQEKKIYRMKPWIFLSRQILVRSCSAFRVRSRQRPSSTESQCRHTGLFAGCPHSKSSRRRSSKQSRAQTPCSASRYSSPGSKLFRRIHGSLSTTRMDWTAAVSSLRRSSAKCSVQRLKWSPSTSESLRTRSWQLRCCSASIATSSRRISSSSRRRSTSFPCFSEAHKTAS